MVTDLRAEAVVLPQSLLYFSRESPGQLLQTHPICMHTDHMHKLAVECFTINRRHKHLVRGIVHIAVQCLLDKFKINIS